MKKLWCQSYRRNLIDPIKHRRHQGLSGNLSPKICLCRVQVPCWCSGEFWRSCLYPIPLWLPHAMPVVAQPVGVGSNIGVAGKQCLAIIATLNDVDRDSDWTVSSAPGHTTLHMSAKFTPCSPATAILNKYSNLPQTQVKKPRQNTSADSGTWLWPQNLPKKKGHRSDPSLFNRLLSF